MDTLAQVIGYSVLTAAATGLGVIPLAFSKAIPTRLMSLAGALASGLLLAVAFDLLHEGMRARPATAILGIVAGLALISTGRKWLEKRAAPEIGRLADAGMLDAVILIGVMTIHSFPEGMAIGLALGKGLHFGFLISLAIALHNIPEGLAVGLVLVPKGMSPWKAGLWSVFTSLPQPLVAVPAFLLVSSFEPLLPFGLGLAAGAMIWMIGAEVLPEACGKATPASIGAALTLGVALMLAIQALAG